MRKETSQLISEDDMNKMPIGYVCHNSWGSNPRAGYVELHPSPQAKISPTVQVIVNQDKKTIEIYGFCESFTKDAMNHWTIVFE